MIVSRITKTVRKNILGEYFRRETLSQEATGKTLSIFENGISSWEQIVTRLMMEDPINISSFVIAFVYLLFLNAKLLPIIVFYMVVVASVSIVAQKYLNPLRKAQRKIREDRSRAFVRSIMEKRTIVFHNAFEYEQEHLEKIQNDFVRKVDQAMKIAMPVYRFPQAFLNIIRAVVACFFAYEVLRNNASLVELVTS